LKYLIILNPPNEPLNENRNIIFSIPKDLINLKHLKDITIRDASLRIKLNIGSLISKNLEILDLSFNKIKGDLEISKDQIELWTSNSNNTNLKILDLSNNLFDMDIDHLMVYPISLKVIKLNNNFLKGNFPFLENHQKLKVLDLRNNTLIGSLNVI